MDVVIAFLMLKSWMDSVSSLLAGGAPGAFIGRPAWARGESCRPGTDVKPKPEPNKST